MPVTRPDLCWPAAAVTLTAIPGGISSRLGTVPALARTRCATSIITVVRARRVIALARASRMIATVSSATDLSAVRLAPLASE